MIGKADNEALRRLMSLPPARASAGAEIASIECPAMVAETGNHEIDMVIWIRRLISTGNPGLIARATRAAKEIQTPLKKLEEAYLRILQANNPGNWTVAFQTFGFADLEGLTKSSIEKANKRADAYARMGDALFEDTPAEEFCAAALKGLKPEKSIGDYDDAKVDARFDARPDLLPYTLSDCLHELAYWRDLYWMRKAVSNHSDGPVEASARRWFVFRRLAKLPPRTKEEALSVFDYLELHDEMGMKEGSEILRNLISGGFTSINEQEVSQ